MRLRLKDEQIVEAQLEALPDNHPQTRIREKPNRIIWDKAVVLFQRHPVHQSETLQYCEDSVDSRFGNCDDHLAAGAKARCAGPGESRLLTGWNVLENGKQRDRVERLCGREGVREGSRDETDGSETAGGVEQWVNAHARANVPDLPE